ncbi:MAG: serine hydrolase [Candidatus Nanopelagicaceae bacterium]|nr:serine hydrolase [Candidatus Nanopelagicaceae bacterium]
MRKFGFERSDVTLENWKDYPYSTWSLQHVAELVPVAKIEGTTPINPEKSIDPGLLVMPAYLDDDSERIIDFLERSYTDAFLVVQNGKVVLEYFANAMTASTPHIIFSVSKSVAGLAAGITAREFGLELDSMVSHYVPVISGGAYETATIRDLLDMKVSLDFTEAYADKNGQYARYRRSMLWMPSSGDEQFHGEDLASYVLSLPKGGEEHGNIFSYRSPNTDVLGLVLEKVSGLRYPDLISKFLWKPIGAQSATITVDNVGASRVAGGISCTAHDLYRIGELLNSEGFISGNEVVPARWIHDTRNNGDARAWAQGDFARLIPGGKYRNQWYVLGGGQLCAIGIHGQWIYVDSENGIVVVRMSSQPLADDDELDSKTLKIFNALTARLALA